MCRRRKNYTNTIYLSAKDYVNLLHNLKKVDDSPKDVKESTRLKKLFEKYKKENIGI